MKNSLLFPVNNNFQYQAVGIIKGVYKPENNNQNKGNLFINDSCYTARLLPKLAVYCQKKEIFNNSDENIFISWIRYSNNKPYFVLKHIIFNDPAFSKYVNNFSIFGKVHKKKKDNCIIFVRRNIDVPKEKQNKEMNKSFYLPIKLKNQKDQNKLKRSQEGSFCQIYCKFNNGYLESEDLYIRPNK